jgi:hypothetical protein
MVIVGSSDRIGSWKTVVTSRPRTSRQAGSVRGISDRPAISISPEAVAEPSAAMMPCTAPPMVDFPEPDSPTSPRQRPASIDRVAFRTACTTRPRAR